MYAFSLLHLRCRLDTSNILMQKEKEDLEEISGELELVDEEEKVP